MRNTDAILGRFEIPKDACVAAAPARPSRVSFLRPEQVALVRTGDHNGTFRDTGAGLRAERRMPPPICSQTCSIAR